MKRSKYTITIMDHNTVLATATKYAWNAAREQIRFLMRTVLEEGESAKLIAQDNKKEGLHYVFSMQSWQTSNGQLLNVQIKKEGYENE